MTLRRTLDRMSRRIALTIRQKILLIAVVSLGSVTLLVGLHLELGASVDAKMKQSDHFRQIRDDLAAMRTAMLQIHPAVKDAVAHRGELTKDQARDLNLPRKDFERSSGRVVDFLTQAGASLGNRDVRNEFAELARVFEQEIEPAARGDDAAAIGKRDRRAAARRAAHAGEAQAAARVRAASRSKHSFVVIAGLVMDPRAKPGGDDEEVVSPNTPSLRVAATARVCRKRAAALPGLASGRGARSF